MLLVKILGLTKVFAMPRETLKRIRGPQAKPFTGSRQAVRQQR